MIESMNNKLSQRYSYSDDYSVEDWNQLIKDSFFDFFQNEEIFNRNKDLLRSEIINYIKIIRFPEYRKLFKDSVRIIKDVQQKSESDYINIYNSHFENITETDFNWTKFFLTQTDDSDLSEHDKIEVKFKSIENILEGCFLERFKFVYHLQCYLQNKEYKDHLDFGVYVDRFKEELDFSLYKFDPIFSIKINQWRNISSHKSYRIRKDVIEIKYGKGDIKKLEISYEEINSILRWVDLMYCSLRLSQVITTLSNLPLLEEMNKDKKKPSIRFEQGLVHIVHNLQIVGFPFFKIDDEGDIFTIYLKMKKSGDLKESVIHSSQCLDTLAFSIFNDEYVKDKYNFARVIITDGNIELGSSIVRINDIYGGNQKDLIDCVKLTIGDITF